MTLRIFSILLSIITILSNLKGQNSLSLEFYQPIQSSGMKEYFNEDWVLTPHNNYNRKYFSGSLGISYSHERKNNVIFRGRFGVTIRSLKETDIYRDTDWPDSNDIITNYKYLQNQYNFFLGVGKKIELGKNFYFTIGVEGTYIYYGKGKGTIDQVWDIYDTRFNILKHKITTKNQINTGTAYSIGLGPILKPEYNFHKRLALSIEFQVFFVYNKITTATENKTTQNEWYIDLDTDGSIYGTHEQRKDYYSKSNYNITQFNWTKFSPLLRISYIF